MREVMKIFTYKLDEDEGRQDEGGDEGLYL
jgi:hypothetical protein